MILEFFILGHHNGRKKQSLIKKSAHILSVSSFSFSLLLLSACTSFTTDESDIKQDSDSRQAPEYSRKYQYEKDGLHGSDTNPSVVKLAIPKKEAKSRYGNPQSYRVYGKRYDVLNSAKGYKQTGGASWYGKKFHGERTSSGESYDMYAMSAAHKTLPLPSYVKVTNLDNQRQVIVRVNDRGPFHQGRIIDLSYSAAKLLGITSKGTGTVEVEAIDVERWQKKQSSNTSLLKKPMIKTTTHFMVKVLYIQMGAFSESENAKKLATNLRLLLKQNVFIKIKKKQGKELYIVKIGPFSSISSKNRIIKQLIEQGYLMARTAK